MSNEDLRRAAARRRLGPDARCKTCGEADELALVTAVLCYACKARQAGRRDVERHHVAGKNNDPFTVDLPANDHRVMTGAQDWPSRTLINPDSSPLLRAAAWIRGVLDLLRLVIDRVLGWVPEYLEKLDSDLTRRLGRRWWNELEGGDA